MGIRRALGQDEIAVGQMPVGRGNGRAKIVPVIAGGLDHEVVGRIVRDFIPRSGLIPVKPENIVFG